MRTRLALIILLAAVTAYAGGQIGVTGYPAVPRTLKGGTGINIKPDGTFEATGEAVISGAIPFDNISTGLQGKYAPSGLANTFKTYTSVDRVTLTQHNAAMATKSAVFANQTTLQKLGTGANGATFAGQQIVPTLALVATTGQYDDLSGKPSLSAVATSGSYADITGTPNLATVATSGSYNDLSNKPTIPAAQVNSNWNASSGVAQILNKPTLATVATSGAYADLTGKPVAYTLPTASPTVLGGVKIDNSSIQIDGGGVIHSTVAAGVSSVAGWTGDVTLETADIIGLDTALNTPAASTFWLDRYAAGDGSTDDSGAIQALIDTPGPVRIIAGAKRYKLATGLKINKPGVTIEGVGGYLYDPAQPATVFEYTGTGPALIVADGTMVDPLYSLKSVYGGLIRNVVFDGVHSGDYGLQLGSATGAAVMSLENVMTTRFALAGTRLVNSQGSVFTNTRNEGNDGKGLLFDNVTGAQNTANLFIGGRDYLNGAEGIEIKNATMTNKFLRRISESNGKEGLVIGPVVQADWYNLSFDTLHVENNNLATGRSSGYYGVKVTSRGGAYRLKNLDFVNPYIIEASGNKGILFDNDGDTSPAVSMTNLTAYPTGSGKFGDFVGSWVTDFRQSGYPPANWGIASANMYGSFESESTTDAKRLTLPYYGYLRIGDSEAASRGQGIKIGDKRHTFCAGAAPVGSPLEGGSWNVGDTCYNTQATAGGYWAYVYTATGWTGFGYIGATATAAQGAKADTALQQNAYPSPNDGTQATSYHLNRNVNASSSEFAFHAGNNTYNPAFDIKVSQPVQGAAYNTSQYTNQMTFGGTAVLSAPAGQGTYLAFRGYSSSAGNTYASGANNDQAIQFFPESASVNRSGYAYPYNQILLRTQQWSGANRFRHFTIYSTDSGFDFTPNRWNIPYGVDYILPNYQSVQGIHYDSGPFDSADRIYLWNDINNTLNANGATAGSQAANIHPVLQLADRVNDLPTGCASANDYVRGSCGSDPTTGGNRQSGFLEFQSKSGVGTWTLSSTAAGIQNIPATEYSAKTEILTATTIGVEVKAPLTIPVTGSTQCLHVNSAGVVSGTGTDCGSGSGSGTVQSGTTGQFAYYGSNGTTVAGRTLAGSDLPDPSATTKGGVKSLAAATNNYLTSIGTDGSVTQARPTIADLAALSGTTQYSSTDGAKLLNLQYSIWPKQAAYANSLLYTTLNIGSATPSANYAGSYHNRYTETGVAAGIGDPVTGTVLGEYYLTRNLSIKAVANMYGVLQSLSTSNASGGGTVTNAVANNVSFGSAAAGQGTITNAYAYKMDAKVGTGTITNYWFLYGADSNASSAIAGGLRIGDTTKPTEKLEVAGNAVVTGNAAAKTFAATIPAAATDGATVTFDLAAGDSPSVTLGGNRTLAFTVPLANVGSWYTLTLKQDATGNRTVTWPSFCTWVKSDKTTTTTPPTLATAANSEDTIVIHVLSTTTAKCWAAGY